MIRHLIERPVAALTGALALVALGVFSLPRLPVTLLPALERPRLVVVAESPGRSRDEVLEEITHPLERGLAAIAGVTAVESETGDGSARVIVESEWQTDTDRLRLDAEHLLGTLDPSVSLSLETVEGDPEPVIEVAVLGGGSRAARATFARDVLLPELARIEGAGRAEIVGAAPLHVAVHPRAAALAARGLTAADVVERLQEVGAPHPAGRARTGDAARPLVVREDVSSLDGLRALRIPGPRGESVLGDVAGIAVETLEDGSFCRVDGQEGILVRLFRAPGAEAPGLAREARSRVAELAGRSTGGFALRIAGDRSGEGGEALRRLGLAALAGLALGILACRALLGGWRPTLALAAVVPSSLLAALAVFDFAGIPLDAFSLAGLALAVGLLVDSSLVVLESIGAARDRGEPAPLLAGTREAAAPVIAGFLTSTVVFVPLLYLHGLARALFGLQAFALATALAAALLFSLTLTPVLAGGPRPAGPGTGRQAYLSALDRALTRPAGVVLAGGLLLAMGIAALVVLPRELIADASARELLVRYRLPADLAPEAARRLGVEVEARAAAALGTRRAKVLGIQWALDDDPGADREESGRLLLTFAAPGDARQARRALADALARMPDVEAGVEPRAGVFTAAIEHAEGSLEIVASAATPERAEALAGRVADRLRRRAGLRPVRDLRHQPRPALLLSWNAARLAALGLDRDRLERQVRSGLGDERAGRVRIEGVEPEILVRAVEPRDPALLPVALAPEAGVVPLTALARFDPGARPGLLERRDGRPAVRLEFRGRGDRVDAGSALADLPLAADEQVAPGGAALELCRAFDQLRLLLPLSLLLVFLSVAAVFESFTLPWAVVAGVPVALAGALGLLAATGQSLDVLAVLALVLLAGIGVHGGIILVHRAERHRAAGLLLDEAVRRAAAERYRPLLLTTATAFLGLLPLALLGGPGVELRRGLAVALLGGLAASAFASLLLVPVVYRALRRRRRDA